MQPRRPAGWVFETLQHIPDSVFAQDIEGRLLVANRALAISCGYDSGGELIGKTVFDLFPAETATAFQAMDARILQTGKPILDREQAIVHADGRRQWIKINRVPLYDDTRTMIGIVCTFRDITEWKESERLLLIQANLLDMVAQSAPLAEICGKIVAVVEDHIPDVTGAIQLYAPDRTQLMAPFAPVRAEGRRPCLDEMKGALVGVATTAIEACETIIISDFENNPAFSSEREILSKWSIKAIWSVPILSPENKALGAMSLMSGSAATPTTVQADLMAMASHMVSAAIERQEAAEHTKFLASHDSLTRLPNRLMFEELLAAAVEAARGTRSHIGLAFFDLDNFKLINDSLGHGAGDALLKTVADRAQGNLRQNDVVARLGGDEFVMFLTCRPAQSDVTEQRFQRVREAISAPAEIDGRTVQVTCSMGVAYFPDHAETAASLIAHADIAMYRAKQMGRDNMQIFAPDMQTCADTQLARLSSLREAVAREEFVLHYQPQVDLDAGRIFGAEALVRWNHPDLGLLYPDGFIALAEETGLIVALGDWVLNVACRQNRKWQDEGFAPIVVSVNVSARQFQEPSLVAQVATALLTSGLAPEFLELELTESLTMQEGAAAKMRELKALGVKLALDDFGTGYSNLSALKRFPLDRLKIDRSFIRDISKDENDQAITGAIIAMADKLRMKVIAEGVETSEHVSLLQQLGCGEAQGYHFSRPVDPESFRTLLGGFGRPSRKPCERGHAARLDEVAC
jgi:diguanylate cyclase (GGDEF)-like protein/PAS domain S-box-containing protein